MSENILEFHDDLIKRIQLPRGKYKLEVWGAKGGDSYGGGYNKRGNQSVQGGLGGYARGILNLTKEETLYIYIGENGRSSNQSDGSMTGGGFPDGGGTKTGHYKDYTTVPGTGGGSTSIRIGNDSNYSRVIVAGGGGGASGSSCHVNPGGFGGGENGGNCYNNSTLKNQGAGTQSCSTSGLGEGQGDPGSFGQGATGKYLEDYDSGGGGGGGWYGGGSGGYGSSNSASSGGGGSGWVFNEASLRKFQSGDSYNASRFGLSSSYYLTETMCAGGNEEFPRPDGKGTERGHAGSGFAKITKL